MKKERIERTIKKTMKALAVPPEIIPKVKPKRAKAPKYDLSEKEFKKQIDEISGDEIKTKKMEASP